MNLLSNNDLILWFWSKVLHFLRRLLRLLLMWRKSVG